MTDKVKNQPVILPAQKVIKKKYVKPDFEVYELNWEAPLLSASGVEGTRQQYRTINNDWE